MTFALHIKKKPTMLFKHLLQFVEYQHVEREIKLDIDQLSVAIYRLIKSRNASYRIADIKYGLRKCMKGR